MILIDLVFLNEKVEDNLQHVRLQQRDEHENTLVIKHSDNLIEISITFGDGLRSLVDCNGIKSSFVNSELEKITLRI